MNTRIFGSINNQLRQLYKLAAHLPEDKQVQLIPKLSSIITETSLIAIEEKVRVAESYLTLKNPRYTRYVGALSEASRLSDQVLAANSNGADLSSEHKKSLAAVYALHAKALFEYDPLQSNVMEKKVMESLRLDPENQLAAKLHFEITFNPFEYEDGSSSRTP